MQTMLQEYMTVKEAAALLRVTDRRIRSLVAEGKLFAERPGERMLLVSRASVDEEASRRFRRSAHQQHPTHALAS
jgi:excisionase family DNA binding protein